MKPEVIATTFDVSVAWAYRLVQRRRETGSIAPRQQTKFRAAPYRAAKRSASSR
jgi:transposase